MNLLKIKCYQDSTFGDKYDEETYSKPIYNEVRWEGTIISSDNGGFEGQVSNEDNEYFIFGYYIPNKGLVLYEYGKNDSILNIMSVEPCMDILINRNNTEILNPNNGIFRMFNSYNEGGYEVANHVINEFCGSTESYCRLILENIKEINKEDTINNEEVKNIINKIVDQINKMHYRHRFAFLKFSEDLQEFTTNNQEEYTKKLNEVK
jgi:hypothetical protein